MPSERLPRPEFDAPVANVTAFRLTRQHLLERAPARRLAAVVGDMGGAQAQLLSAGGISVAARTRGLREPDVERSVFERRSLVRAWCMRRTLHLLPADRLAVFVRGSARRADRELTWVRNRGVGAHRLDALLGALREALDEPVDAAELVRRAGAHLGIAPGTRRGAGWGNRRPVPSLPFEGINFPASYLMALAGAREVICFGAKQGLRQTYVRADRWLPGWRDLPPEHAEEELLRIYLRTFAPAKAEDFAFWTGLRLRDVRAIWTRIGGEVAPVATDGGLAYALRADLDILAGAELTPTVRLLPFFDGFLMGHRGRGHLVEPHRRGHVYRPAGWVAPVVLVNGRVAGTWEHRLGKRGLECRVRPFSSLPRWAARELRDEAGALADYLGVPLGPGRVV